MKHSNRSLKRRWMILATLAAVPAVIAGGLAGAGSAVAGSTDCKAASGKVKLTFWSWVPGIPDAVKVWNAKNPNIQVSVKVTPSGNAGTYQNMFNGVKAGTAPDLGQIEFDSLPAFRLQNAVRDIGPCGAEAIKSQFVSWTLSQVQFGEDAIYAIPQDTGPMALYYRKDLFKKFGIAVPKTWADFARAAETVKKKDKTAFITHFPQRDTNWFAGLAWQAGARWFSTDGGAWKVTINDAATKQVASYWDGLLKKKLVANYQGFSPQWSNALAKGKVLTWVSAVWGNNTIATNAPKTTGKWAVAPMPQWKAGDKKAGNWGGSTTAVFKGSKYPLEATKFAIWLNTDPQAQAILNKKGGLYPATNAGLNLAALKSPSKFYGNQRIFDVFKAASSQVDVSFQWGPVMTTTYTDLADGFGPVLNGKGTLAAAVATAEKKTIDAIKQQGLKIAD